ncbi:MAG TPA: hypothetical protein H9825_00145 [Candidatus Sphingobacterium stercorigallinarum]|nr:hypothetical protein [Candidatus Sphingobacterium stercorigallinarum]
MGHTVGFPSFERWCIADEWVHERRAADASRNGDALRSGSVETTEKVRMNKNLDLVYG